MTVQLACLAQDVPVEGTYRVELEDDAGKIVEVAVVRDSDGTLHAINDVCSHGAVSLSEGEVDGCFIECWLHGSRFDLRTAALFDSAAAVEAPSAIQAMGMPMSMTMPAADH